MSAEEMFQILKGEYINSVKAHVNAVEDLTLQEQLSVERWSEITALRQQVVKTSIRLTEFIIQSRIKNIHQV